MSEAVEMRLVELLEYPRACPHGNPIPGLDELGAPEEAQPAVVELAPMSELAIEDATPVVVRRIGEQVQNDAASMLKLKQVGIQPGREVTLASGEDGVRVTCDQQAETPSVELPLRIADHVYVSRR